MRRLSLCLVAAIGALVIVPAALADGQPLLVTQGGTGVASHVPPRLHYVAISDRAGGTLLETIDVAHGGVFGWARLHGSWGIPAIGTGYSTGQGLSRDDRTLILGSVGSPYVSPSKFLVVDTRRLKAVRTISLDGMFTFDALSPHGSRLYLIQYASVRDLSHYIVRAYDLRAHRLIPGKIADLSEDEKTMAFRRDADDERERPVGVHALPEAVRRAVRACARHGRRQGVLHRPPGEPRAVQRRPLAPQRRPDARRALAERAAVAERRRRQLADLLSGLRLPVGMGRRRDRWRASDPRGGRCGATPSAPPRRETRAARGTGARARVASGSGRSRAR